MVHFRDSISERPPNVRAALSNGRRAFLRADGRTREGRLLIDREREFAAALGDNLNVAERARVQTAAILSVRIEMARSEFARGESQTSAEDLVRMSNALNRELAAIAMLAEERKEAQGPLFNLSF